MSIYVRQFFAIKRVAVANGIKIAEKKLTEFEQIYNFTTDSQLRHDMH
ncbi:83_t:CDS:2, partial [Entrophospora sp. SA101]